MGDLDVLRSHRPEVAPPTDDVRRLARAELAAAMRADAPARRHLALRLSTAVVVVVAAVATMFVGWGSPASEEPSTKPWLVGPQPAGALTTAEQTDDGATEIRFLHPTADPERIRAELQQHGFDISVSFVPADPFSVGTLVMYSGDNGIETIREGTDLTGGGYGHDVGIVVPSGWAGSAHLGIGREALRGERFDSSVAINAERPGGPMHCVGIRGLRAVEAAQHVTARGFTVEWRTQKRTVFGDRHEAESPPEDYFIHDLLWTAPDEIMLFAAAGEPEAPSDVVAELMERGCDGSSR